MIYNTYKITYYDNNLFHKFIREPERTCYIYSIVGKYDEVKTELKHPYSIVEDIINAYNEGKDLKAFGFDRLKVEVLCKHEDTKNEVGEE
jgi:hypothetical protein